MIGRRERGRRGDREPHYVHVGRCLHIRLGLRGHQWRSVGRCIIENNTGTRQNYYLCNRGANFSPVCPAGTELLIACMALDGDVSRGERVDTGTVDPEIPEAGKACSIFKMYLGSSKGFKKGVARRSEYSAETITISVPASD